MHTPRLVLRGLMYYWRTHLAMVLGVATAVAVLAGALLVGDSVRGSLRDLVLGRLGATRLVVASAGFVREQLAEDIQRRSTPASFSAIAPLIVAEGMVTEQQSGRRVGQVRVYGVDNRFWRFHGVRDVHGPADRDVFVSESLAAELGAAPGASLLVRVQRPTDLPLETLHSRKDDLGRTLRLTIRDLLPAASMGDFSLEPQQGEVRAAFVPLALLQEQMEVPRRVNTLLVAAPSDSGPDIARELQRLAAEQAQLEDVGLAVTTLSSRGTLAVTSDTGLLDDAHAAVVDQAIRAAGLRPQPVLTYLANTLRVNDREVPYSLVTAMDVETIASSNAPNAPNAPNDSNASNAPNAPNVPNVPNDSIVLNAWAAAELRARPGDTLAMDYFVWEEPGQLVTRTTEFRVTGIVPVEYGDRDLAPAYPGISDSPTLDDWDPPFPIDLGRVRPQDEAYWQRYRTTPKAFVPLETGQRLWRSRYGALTSVRAVPVAQPLDAAREALEARLRDAIDPLALGLAVRDVRVDGLSASRGATDFGAYFVYFSFFIVVSALLLASLFFKLGVEQRVREVGLLRAVGFRPGDVRRLFLGEGVMLAVAGSALGVLGALAYAWVIMLGLRSWWLDAVGTTALTLHVAPLSLLVGAAGGVMAAVGCIWWTLRSLGRVSERSLLMGQLSADPHVGAPASRQTKGVLVAAVLLAVLAVGLLAASAAEWIDRAGAFFGAGSALLGASLCLFLDRLRRQPRSGVTGRGWKPVSRLGLRNATYRPGRSVLSIAVIASATFILISVDAFRRGDVSADAGRQTGLGGYALFVETLLPVVHDPNTSEGRDALNLFSLDSSVRIEPFRLQPGDDASCLNLYQPRNPRVVAPSDGFIDEGRFAFQDSLATTDEDRANPWRLLHRVENDGAVPVIADANSMTYVLHLALGGDMVITRGGREIRLRIVAALRDSIFQGELLMSQANFLRLFPEQQGYRLLLVEAPEPVEAEIATQIEDALVDFGADATRTSERLAEFHRVENTYLSTFQTLGGLGLLLGTVGLATVLLRNVLERRRELALLSAVGYRRRHVLIMTVAESVLLLAGGLLIGGLSAVLAIAPAAAERGGRLPLTSGAALLLFTVFVAGLMSSVVAVRAATHAPVLSSLRSE